MVLNIRILALAAVVIVVSWMFVQETQAQVTFSRDWKPGKRVIDNPEFHNSMNTATALCHLLMNQIRQMAACENRVDDLDPGTNTVFTGRR